MNDQPANYLLDLIALYRRDGASLSQIRQLAADIGNRHFAEGIPILLELLHHNDEIVRYNSAGSLAFEFHYEAVTNDLLRMLTEDPSEDCRDTAAIALGSLCRDTGALPILVVLAKAATNDPDNLVRLSAYKAFLSVNGMSADQHLKLRTSDDLAVDLKKIDSIIQERMK